MNFVNINIIHMQLLYSNITFFSVLLLSLLLFASFRWVIFNDQKVCASEKPPKDLGYLYFYRRVVE